MPFSPGLEGLGGPWHLEMNPAMLRLLYPKSYFHAYETGAYSKLPLAASFAVIQNSLCVLDLGNAHRSMEHPLEQALHH